MTEKIAAYVQKHHMLAAGDTVAAGISGGADSVCLLFVLQELRRTIPFRLMAVHVNHLIRVDAGADAAYVKALCARLDVPYYLVEEDVGALADRQGISLEEAGRQARYEAFERVLAENAPAAVKEGTARIAVAHNSNDRAETMLFHLFRGTGLAGLCGIRPVRNQIIRPLLCMERYEIEQYLTQRGIDWCVDYTNAQDAYTRNKIRHHILPYAEEEIVKGCVSHMGRTADVLLEIEDFLDQAVQTAYGDCRADGAGIRIYAGKAAALHPLVRRQLILHCLKLLSPTRRNITAIHVKDIENLLMLPGNRYICLPYDICVRREYDVILFQKGRLKEEKEYPQEAYMPEELSSGAASMEVPGLGILDFRVFANENKQNIPQKKYTKWFDYDKIKKSPIVRNRLEGDFLTINEALSHKSIKDYMIAEKIPREERDRIWLLADGRHIIWVIGYRISEEYKVSQNTKHILTVQLRGGHEEWQSISESF